MGRVVLIQLPLCECLVFIQSIYCMSVSDLLLALFHLRLLIPLHRFLLPYFCTSHVLLPTLTVKLENLFGAIQTQMILSVCSNYFIADRRMDVHKYQWPGMSLQLFPQPCNVIIKDNAIQTLFFPPALISSVKQKSIKYLIVITALILFFKS